MATQTVGLPGTLNLSGPVRAYEVTPVVGESTHEAFEYAQTWLVSLNKDVADDTSPGDD